MKSDPSDDPIASDVYVGSMKNLKAKATEGLWCLINWQITLRWVLNWVLPEHMWEMTVKVEVGERIKVWGVISDYCMGTSIAQIGSYNTQHLLALLNALCRHPICPSIVWRDHVSFQHANVVKKWFALHKMISADCPPLLWCVLFGGENIWPLDTGTGMCVEHSEWVFWEDYRQLF